METNKEAVYSYEDVLTEVKKAMDEQDNIKRSNICVAIVALGGNCLTRLTEVALDKTLDFYTRRYALKIASGFRGEQLYEFIRRYCLAGKTKGEVLRAADGTDEGEARIALFVTGEEILNTPNFFKQYVAKDSNS